MLGPHGRTSLLLSEEAAVEDIRIEGIAGVKFDGVALAPRSTPAGLTAFSGGRPPAAALASGVGSEVIVFCAARVPARIADRGRTARRGLLAAAACRAWAMRAAGVSETPAVLANGASPLGIGGNERIGDGSDVTAVGTVGVGRDHVDPLDEPLICGRLRVGNTGNFVPTARLQRNGEQLAVDGFSRSIHCRAATRLRALCAGRRPLGRRTHRRKLLLRLYSWQPQAVQLLTRIG